MILISFTQFLRCSWKKTQGGLFGGAVQVEAPGGAATPIPQLFSLTLTLTLTLLSSSLLVCHHLPPPHPLPAKSTLLRPPTQCYLKPSFCQFAISQSRAGSAQAANSNRAFMFMCRPPSLPAFSTNALNLNCP